MTSAWTGQLVDALASITHARDARAAAGDGTHLALLPVWSHLPPGIHLGRKHDSTPTVPVRITWDTTHAVLLAPGTTRTLVWTLAGMGHSATGTLTLTLDGHDLQTVGDLPPAAEGPDLLPAGPVTLDRLDEQARVARWTSIMSMEPLVTMAVTSASVHVAADVQGAEWTGAGSQSRIIDDIALEQVSATLLLGSDQGQTSAVDRIIDRCLEPGAFRAVEPEHYVCTDLRRTAKAAVRRAVGDPAIGSKIRHVARTLGTDDLQAVVEDYRRRHPGDHLSLGRATSALTVPGVQHATPTSTRAVIDQPIGVDPTFEAVALILEDAR